MVEQRRRDQPPLSLAAGAAGFLPLLPAGHRARLGSIPARRCGGGRLHPLARRTGKQLEAVMAVAQKEMMARKPERPSPRWKQAFPLARWQFGVSSSLHANIGVLLYVQKKFDEAEPHLRKSGGTLLKLWQAQAMLGAQMFRKKQYRKWKGLRRGIRATERDAALRGLRLCENQRGEKKRPSKFCRRASTRTLPTKS